MSKTEFVFPPPITSIKTRLARPEVSQRIVGLVLEGLLLQGLLQQPLDILELLHVIFVVLLCLEHLVNVID